MTQKFKEDQHSKNGQKNITRKEALLKAGKYAAFTAAAMMLILDPVNADPPDKSKPKPPRPGMKQKKAKRTDPPPSY